MTSSIPPNITTEFTACLQSFKSFTPKEQHLASMATIKHGSLKMPVPSSSESQARDMHKTITVRFVDQEFINELDALSDQVEQGNVDQLLMKKVLDKIQTKSGYYLRVKTGKQIEGVVLTSENDRSTVVAAEKELLLRKLQKQQTRPTPAAEPPTASEPSSSETVQRPPDAAPSATEEATSPAPRIEDNITVLDSNALDQISQAAQEAAQVFAALIPKPVEKESAGIEAQESAKESEKPPVSQIAQPSTAETRTPDTQEQTRQNTATRSANKEAEAAEKSEKERAEQQEADIRKGREKQKESKAELEKTVTSDTEQNRQDLRRVQQTKKRGQVGQTDQEGDPESVRAKTISTPTGTPQPGAIEPAAPPQEQQRKGVS